MDNNIQATELIRGVTYDEEPELIRGVTYDDENEKTYLILIEGQTNDNDGELMRDWDFKVGRQEAYDYIKNYLESDYIVVDVINSKIVVSSEKIKVTDGVSIFKFMKAMKEDNKVIDETSFDITDYLPGGEVEGAE
jgi:hypothetical protein